MARLQKGRFGADVIKLYSAMVVLIATANPAWACRCDFTGINALKADPTTAPIAFVGTIVDAKPIPKELAADQTTFKVEKAWKGVEGSEITLPVGSSGTTCGHGVKKGKKYLVLALGPHYPLVTCNSAFITERQARPFLAKLGEPQKAAAKPEATPAPSPAVK